MMLPPKENLTDDDDDPNLDLPPELPDEPAIVNPQHAADKD